MTHLMTSTRLVAFSAWLIASGCARTENTNSVPMPSKNPGDGTPEANLEGPEVITLPNGQQVTVTAGSTGVGVSGGTIINGPVPVNVHGQAVVAPPQYETNVCLKEKSITFTGSTNGRIDINFNGSIPSQRVSIFTFYGDFSGNGAVDWTAVATLTGRASTQWDATLHITANTLVNLSGHVYRSRPILRRKPDVNVLNLGSSMTLQSTDIAKLRGDCGGIIDLETGDRLNTNPTIGTSVQFNGLFPNLFPRLLANLRARIGSQIAGVANAQLNSQLSQSMHDVNSEYNNVKGQLLGVLLEKLPKSSRCTCPPKDNQPSLLPPTQQNNPSNQKNHPTQEPTQDAPSGVTTLDE